MDEPKKKDRIDSIRVVDDSSEEVVRLESSPKRVRAERKGGISVETIEARHIDSVGDVEAVRPFDPEEKWLDGKADLTEKAVPMGWFFLLGAVLLGVVVWAGFQMFSDPPKSGGGGASSGLGQRSSMTGEPLEKKDELVEEQIAEAHFLETERILRAFFDASNPEERVKYVRHPERVFPLMKDYYSRNDFQKISYEKITQYRIYPLEKLPFLALQVEDGDGEKYPILLEDGDDGILVDWESFVCFQPVLIEDYVRDCPTQLTSLRAYVSSDYFHSYEFEDREKYASYRLSFRNSEVLLNGYVERGTELDQKFRKLFPEGGTAQWKPLIIKVRYLEGGRAKNSVLIEDLESTIWAYAKNPTEVASSQK